MNGDTLVFDTGEDIVGIYSIKQGEFIPYCGEIKRKGVERLLRAKEIVSYNGNRYDLKQLAKFLGLADDQGVNLLGRHTDMEEVCWSSRILGKSLRDTYRIQFGTIPLFPDTYEGSCECDVFMTRKLWECWKAGTLKMVDGNLRQ